MCTTTLWSDNFAIMVRQAATSTFFNRIRLIGCRVLMLTVRDRQGLQLSWVSRKVQLQVLFYF